MRRGAVTTLQDVAREAGVTAMTVSVVLNGARSATRVSDATRQRIMDAATRLRYRPNAVARGLSRRRMDTLGVVAVVDGGELNLYFLEVLNGILEAAARTGQNTTVFGISDWRADEGRILECCDGRVDGIICIAPLFSQTFAETLSLYAPFVSIHSDIATTGSINLNIDNAAGACEAVRHLIAKGHRRIMHITGSLTQRGARDRLAGYRCALEEAGIAFDEALVFEAEFSEHSGREQMRTILEGGYLNPLPTALFCASDAIAFGAMETLGAFGLLVPEDISVVGFDDTLNARTTLPQLTTVRQPFRQLGRRAVERLLTRIRFDNQNMRGDKNVSAGGVADIQLSSRAESPGPAPLPDTEIFDVELVVRGSAGPPPQRPLTSPDYRRKERLQ